MKEFIDPYLKLFKNILFKVSDLRRAGSAAFDLAYLAAGRCEGFFEIGLGPVGHRCRKHYYRGGRRGNY